MRRRGRLAHGGVVLVALLLTVVGASGASAAAAADLRPDLRMLKPSNVRLCAPPAGLTRCPTPPAPGGGVRLLRFDAVIVNEGKGPFIVRATRPTPNAGHMTTRQVLRRTDGSTRVVPSDAIEQYATEDDHHHWHVQGIEHYQLHPLGEPVEGPPPVGHKVGFCFFDGVSWRPNMPRAAPVPAFDYYDCGVPSSQSLRVGLSVGWGDIYPWDFGGQFIDVSGVPVGDYLLCLTADPNRDFLETREGDNDSWARVTLGDTAVTVHELGRTRCRAQLAGAASPPALAAATLDLPRMAPARPTASMPFLCFLSAPPVT